MVLHQELFCSRMLVKTEKVSVNILDTAYISLFCVRHAGNVVAMILTARVGGNLG